MGSLDALSSSKPEQHGHYKRSYGPLNLSALYTPEAKASEEDGNLMSVTRWTSQASGLKVVHLDVPGPLCDFYAAVATEVTNDSGIPHTLEHALFLGSEQYPYKGILDQLANRAFAEGTNAWTDTTNTVYTTQTAGSDGFLRLLPIYMDHVFFPTLTQEGFVTEVYHIDGKGNDSGVVYSEMQGVENQADSIMQLAMQRRLYPESSGYRSETGGLMGALRKLTIEEIRDFHALRYKPWNVTLFVAGRMDSNKLLEVLDTKVEPTFAKHGFHHGPRGPADYKRPFVETPTAKSWCSSFEAW